MYLGILLAVAPNWATRATGVGEFSLLQPRDSNGCRPLVLMTALVTEETAKCTFIPVTWLSDHSEDCSRNLWVFEPLGCSLSRLGALNDAYTKCLSASAHTARPSSH